MDKELRRTQGLKTWNKRDQIKKQLNSKTRRLRTQTKQAGNWNKANKNQTEHNRMFCLPALLFFSPSVFKSKEQSFRNYGPWSQHPSSVKQKS